MKSKLMLLSSLSLLTWALAARPALAQGTENAEALNQGPPTQGPMVVERVKSGFLVAPDFKVTEVDHSTSELLGAYAGWLTDQTFLIGGGGYWLVNGAGDRDMGYGGLVVQWFVRAKDPIAFSVKGLVGGGWTDTSTTISRPIPVDFRGGRGDTGRPGTPTITTVRYRTETGFFVFEPEANVLIRITRGMRLAAGVGYRVIAAEYGDDSRLRGVVGSVGVQFGGGS